MKKKLLIGISFIAAFSLTPVSAAGDDNPFDVNQYIADAHAYTAQLTVNAQSAQRPAGNAAASSVKAKDQSDSSSGSAAGDQTQTQPLPSYADMVAAAKAALPGAGTSNYLKQRDITSVKDNFAVLDTLLTDLVQLKAPADEATYKKHRDAVGGAKIFLKNMPSLKKIAEIEVDREPLRQVIKALSDKLLQMNANLANLHADASSKIDYAVVDKSTEQDMNVPKAERDAAKKKKEKHKNEVSEILDSVDTIIADNMNGILLELKPLNEVLGRFQDMIKGSNDLKQKNNSL